MTREITDEQLAKGYVIVAEILSGGPMQFTLCDPSGLEAWIQAIKWRHPAIWVNGTLVDRGCTPKWIIESCTKWLQENPRSLGPAVFTFSGEFAGPFGPAPKSMVSS